MTTPTDTVTREEAQSILAWIAAGKPKADNSERLARSLIAALDRVEEWISAVRVVENERDTLRAKLEIREEDVREFRRQMGDALGLTMADDGVSYVETAKALRAKLTEAEADRDIARAVRDAINKVNDELLARAKNAEARLAKAREALLTIRDTACGEHQCKTEARCALAATDPAKEG